MIHMGSLRQSSSQPGNCRKISAERKVDGTIQSPCLSETNDCAKAGTVHCSLSCSVRSDRKIRTGHSDQPIDILVRLHHTFVANRFSVIHENSAPQQWRHVSSKHNPADEVTRGLAVDEMSATSKWLRGPELLKKMEEFWPWYLAIHQPKLSDHDLVIKSKIQLYNQSSTRHAREEVLSRLIERYWASDRLRRTAAWLLRIRTWFIERYYRSSINCRLQGCLEMGPLLSLEEVK